jgi:alkanesulfonate monooxygenase SsuD/methylene tetrahydromethanopterin reductase-like flavin-dependent oxidoreductase (luciferase family)
MVVEGVDRSGSPIRRWGSLPHRGTQRRRIGLEAVRGRDLPVLAVTLPQFSTEPGPAVEACLDARRLGFGGAFVFDHLWPLGQPGRPALEGWTLLAALAAAVGREPGGAGGFRVGTLVTRAGLRAPALVARMAATVGQVAGAGAIVGVGRGDLANRAENQAFGLPFGDAAERARVLEATVAALRGPLAGTPPPDVWVGGTGPEALAMAGRVADAWNGWARTPEELAAGLAVVRREAERAGRDPATVAATWGGQVLVAPDRREAADRLARWVADRPPAETARLVAGDPATVLARLRALGDAGAAWCVLAAVGGPGAEARALLAAAAGLPGRDRNG